MDKMNSPISQGTRATTLHFTCVTYGRSKISNCAMEQHTLKNVNNCFNTSIYSYLETSGVQSLYQYLNEVHFFNTSVN